MITCPQCGSEQPDGTAFCDNCGYALGKGGQSPQMGSQNRPSDGAPTMVASNNCPSCGAPMPSGEDFCPNCGAQLTDGAGQAGAGTPEPPALQQQPGPTPSSSQAAGSMLTCPNCGAQLAPDSVFCDMCGTRLDATEEGTPHPQPPQQPQEQPSPPQPQQQEARSPQPQAEQQPQQLPPQYQEQYGGWQSQPQPGPGPVASGMQARLVVQGTNVTLPFPPGKNAVIIGREDPVSNIFPDIDLTDHGGDEGGVSREHARIYMQGGQFYIEDLESVNHTYVNRQELPPKSPHPLNNGDELRLGRVKLNFQRT